MRTSAAPPDQEQQCTWLAVARETEGPFVIEALLRVARPDDRLLGDLDRREQAADQHERAAQRADDPEAPVRSHEAAILRDPGMIVP